MIHASPCTQATSDTQFAEYTVKTAFLFPGQGAQTVGMAKVRSATEGLDFTYVAK